VLSECLTAYTFIICCIEIFALFKDKRVNIRMVSDIGFQLVPVTVIAPDFLAKGADGDNALHSG
jgi:hypothetical protein